jgi:hypothetical protein
VLVQVALVDAVEADVVMDARPDADEGAIALAASTLQVVEEEGEEADARLRPSPRLIR